MTKTETTLVWNLGEIANDCRTMLAMVKQGDVHGLNGEDLDIIQSRLNIAREALFNAKHPKPPGNPSA